MGCHNSVVASPQRDRPAKVKRPFLDMQIQVDNSEFSQLSSRHLQSPERATTGENEQKVEQLKPESDPTKSLEKKSIDYNEEVEVKNLSSKSPDSFVQMLDQMHSKRAKSKEVRGMEADELYNLDGSAELYASNQSLLENDRSLKENQGKSEFRIIRSMHNQDAYVTPSNGSRTR